LLLPAALPNVECLLKREFPLRRTITVTRPILGLVLLSILGASAASAQQPDSLAVLKQLTLDQLMDIQVTSVSGRPEQLGRTASAIQVISTEDIRRSGAATLPEVLRLASNLQVAQVDARQWAISARGFNGTTANKLLVLIDGRTIYTPLFSGVFWDVQDVPLPDVERIEVISGPGATLWGANAVNGVINVITKDAAATQGVVLRGAGGTELRGLGLARYGGSLGANAHYRLYAKTFARDATELSTGQDGVDDWRMSQGGFRADWQSAASDHVTLQGDLYGGRIGQPSAGDIAVSGGNASATWAHTVSPTAGISARLYYDRTERNIPGTFGEDLDIYDVDLRHHATLARHELVWGVGYRLMNDRVRNTPGLAFLPTHVARQWFTGFVQDEIALVPERLHLTLGTKLEHNDYTGFEVQPSGRINWTINSTATLWAAISRAVRTPSRIDRELFVPAQPPFFLAGGPDFDSETALSYELGYRHQQGALLVSAATFYTRYHGLRSLEQVNPPAATPLVIANGQDGEAYGAELAANYRATDRWRVRVGYTELRVHIWPLAGSTDTTRGASENRSPDRQLLVRSSLDLPGQLRWDAGFRYVGEIANQQLPAYAELSSRLTWQPIAALELSVAGQNLLHEEHAEFGTPAARRGIERGVYGMIQWHF
jgi:iron complex outermembrane receptor protein